LAVRAVAAGKSISIRYSLFAIRYSLFATPYSPSINFP
jgi:hypothetical protein